MIFSAAIEGLIGKIQKRGKKQRLFLLTHGFIVIEYKNIACGRKKPRRKNLLYILLISRLGGFHMTRWLTPLSLKQPPNMRNRRLINHN